MLEIDVTADALVGALMRISADEPVCILDSCAVGHLGSHLLIAGVRPTETIELTSDDPDHLLRIIDDKLSGNLAGIFSLSYDFGAKIQRIPQSGTSDEPDLFLALFEALVIHDYNSGRTLVVGDEKKLDGIQLESEPLSPRSGTDFGSAQSNFTQRDYYAAVETIQEYIRSGDTYQTNLTQQLISETAKSPEEIFLALRRDHPAPFGAFLKRSSSTVVSASPERFFCINRDGSIESSPIKGTRRRGDTPEEDAQLRAELVASEKDRAENTMIVDLVRNDLGRVCEFGSVKVEKLCDVEEHPTLFHLVSTVRGELRRSTKFSEILRATFPCGSITGAPKIRTMQIIEELETERRGLSMGSIGIYLPPSWDVPVETVYDLSVAIRTMVVRDGVATFNVGGGIVIDSIPFEEYDESMLKAFALLKSLGHLE